jgi:hypothetical protein
LFWSIENLRSATKSSSAHFEGKLQRLVPIAKTEGLPAPTAAAVTVMLASGTSRETGRGAPSVCQPEAGQGHSGQANAEFLERLPSAGGLGQSLGQFIEFVTHTFPFVLFVFLFNRGFHG